VQTTDKIIVVQAPGKNEKEGPTGGMVSTET
jgi:hypothetical protein